MTNKNQHQKNPTSKEDDREGFTDKAGRVTKEQETELSKEIEKCFGSSIRSQYIFDCISRDHDHETKMEILHGVRAKNLTGNGFASVHDNDCKGVMQDFRTYVADNLV